jgi:Ca2+-binding EF-hand superfamily protein
MKAITLLSAVALVSFASAAAWANPPAGDAPRSRAECASLFMTLDTDADGRISRHEASADPVIASAFDELNIGDSGYMSLDEFLEACQKAGARPHRKP